MVRDTTNDDFLRFLFLKNAYKKLAISLLQSN